MVLEVGFEVLESTFLLPFASERFDNSGLSVYPKFEVVHAVSPD